MVLLVDTSVWVAVLRHEANRARLEAALGGNDPHLCRLTQLELLQGARDENEWQRLFEVLETQTYLETEPAMHAAAARVFFELRRLGKTVRSPIDCLIAQVALEHDATVLHCDRDFEAIATVRPLSQRRLDLASG